MSCQEKVTKMKVIRQKVIEGMEDSLNQVYMYIVPYNEFLLTSSKNPNEVSFLLNNVYIAVKGLRDSTKKLFEIYDDDSNKIGEAVEGERIKFDKEITEELVKLKQAVKKMNEEPGSNFKVAGLDELGNLEAYMQMVDREIMSLTASQKKEIDSKGKEPDSRSLDNKKDQEAMDASQQKELQIQEIANDLEIDPQDIYQTAEIQDDAYFRDVGVTNSNELVAIKTRDDTLQIVSKGPNGKFEKSKDFGEGTNEMGRTTYTTNNYNNLSESNTYGAIPFANNPNMRIAGRIGQYGELELIRQERVTSNPDGRTMSEDEIWSPGVLIQTDNTARGDMDLDGEYSDAKVVHTKMDFDNIRMNSESSTIRSHGGENLKIQDIGNQDSRGASALEKVEAELKSRGVKMSAEDKAELQKKFQDRGTTFCQEEVETFCDNYEAYLKQKETQEQGEEEYEGPTLANTHPRGGKRPH